MFSASDSHSSGPGFNSYANQYLDLFLIGSSSMEPVWLVGLFVEHANKQVSHEAAKRLRWEQ